MQPQTHMAEQKDLFKKIALGSVRNILVFGAITLGIVYLAQNFDLGIVPKIAAVFTIFFMLLMLNALILFTVYTIRSIKPTMESLPENIGFKEIYGYTFAALSIRFVEAVFYILYFIYLFKGLS
ncbi:MAG TPA: hypothetical protein GX404_10090 [Syntrophomonadaceae bacterium]|nr:hypothetical protein [Syntrophomonadaceae bacterium]